LRDDGQSTVLPDVSVEVVDSATPANIGLQSTAAGAIMSRCG